MKVEKNKIVFAAVLAVIFLFLISYSVMIMGDDENETENLEQTLVPDLEENQKEYDSMIKQLTSPASQWMGPGKEHIGFYDMDLNKDHRLTCEVAKIIGRPKIKPISILGCEIPSTSFWNGRIFPANYYVDISNHINLKIEAFSKYHNEIQEYPHPWSKKGLKLLAEYHGMQSGFQYAEAFNIIRGYEDRLV